VSQTTGRRRPYAARVPLEERREQLLDAALAVIVRDGYDGVSIGAIDGLGVLLTTLLDRQQVRAFGRLLQALPNEPDPTDPTGFVAEAVRRMVAMLREDPDTWRPILLAPEGMPAVVQERIEADRAQVLALFTSMIESVSAANTGPPLDAELLAHAVLAIVEHFGRVLLTDPDRFDAERMVVTVEQLFGMLWR